MFLLLVLGRVSQVLLVLAEFVAVLSERLLRLLQLLLFHDDVFTKSLSLLVLVINGNLGSEDLARVLYEVLD